MNEWFYLDPDFRLEHRRLARLAKEQGLETFNKVVDTQPYCLTCFRNINPAIAIRVETYWDYKEAGLPLPCNEEQSARISEIGTHFIGQDCFKRLSKLSCNNEKV